MSVVRIVKPAGRMLGMTTARLSAIFPTHVMNHATTFMRNGTTLTGTRWTGPPVTLAGMLPALNGVLVLTTMTAAGKLVAIAGGP